MIRYAALGLLLVACSHRDRQEPSTAVPQDKASASTPGALKPSLVRWFGALHAIMHEGQVQGAVRLSDVVPGPHAWGLGALEGLRGEVTVMDDVAWLALPLPEGRADVRRADLAGGDHEQQAALLVVASVAQWSELPVESDVPAEGLDGFLGEQLRAHGFPLTEPTPVRIEGPVALIRWHVVDGSKLQPGATHADHARTAVAGQLTNTEAKLVGFFSEGHQGVFTHAGSASHFHVVARADTPVSGHVDRLALARGSRLFLPSAR